MKTFVKILWFAIVIFLTAGLSCCSPTWHYRRILEKDPDYFRTDTATTIRDIQVPVFQYAYNCDSLKIWKRIELAVPIIREDGRQDTARVSTMYNESTGQTETTVDCPDAQIIEKQIPEPYPVYLIPKKEKAKWFAAGFCLAFIITGLFGLIISIRNARR